MVTGRLYAWVAGWSIIKKFIFVRVNMIRKWVRQFKFKSTVWRYRAAWKTKHKKKLIEL